MWLFIPTSDPLTTPTAALESDVALIYNRTLEIMYNVLWPPSVGVIAQNEGMLCMRRVPELITRPKQDFKQKSEQYLRPDFVSTELDHPKVWQIK